MSRRDDLRTFHVTAWPNHMPRTERIPIKQDRYHNYYIAVNLALRNSLQDFEYKAVAANRPNFKKVNLEIFTHRYKMEFSYLGSFYRATFDPGAIVDYASVPWLVVSRNLTKRGQHIDEAAVLHDLLFASHYFSFHDANVIFEGMINEIGLTNRYTTVKYLVGVRSPIGRRIYKSIDPQDHWLNDYARVEKLNERGVYE